MTIAAPGPADGHGPVNLPGTTSGRELTYEQARDELVEVVRALEAGGTSLEESLTLWERGESLAQTCQHLLDGAQTRLDAALTPPPDV